MSDQPFGTRLQAAVRRHGPLCVGIDPHRALISDWGLADDPAGLERFSRTVVEALADRVTLLKPQSAFFERHGAAGIAVLERVVADIRTAGGMVLLDVKRGDVGSTVQAYADAYLGPAALLRSDAVTASPYLGFEALRPLLDSAHRHGAGVFVLALTSNPEGWEVQHARTAGGRSVAATILAAVRQENHGTAASWGDVGAVVGATADPAGVDLRVGGPLLAPGLGAQGGTVADLRRVFGRAAPDVLPSASRDVLRAGPDVRRLRDVAARLVDHCQAVLYS